MTADLLLVLDRRDSLIRLEGHALRVERPDGALQRVPLGILGMVIVQGAPAVTCDVWRALAERNIPAVLVPLRGRGGVAWLGAGLSTAIQVRRRQHELARDMTATLGFARRLLSLKLQQQRRLLTALPAPFDSLPSGTLDTALAQHLAALDLAPDIPALMGQEGAAAAAWYGWLAPHLPAHWHFSGRNRRPPRDPVNALLSLGYTLLMAEMLSAVQAAGLDPAQGFLHSVVPGRESLVLDLMEPLRPGVDALALRLLDHSLQPHQFTQQAEQGCRLNKEGRGVFYHAWAEARRFWALPLAPASGSGEALQLTAEAETAADQSLRTQCRRMVHWLRLWLQPGDEGLASDELSEKDDG
jgi:CRISPR-associated protein Cas1